MASSYGRMGVQIVTTFLLTPFLLHRLGAEAFGLWALTLAIASYFGIADSITMGAVRYVSHYRALKDWEGLNNTIGAASRIYFALTVIALIICGVVAALAPHLFLVSPNNLFVLRLLILNMGLISAIGFASVLPIQCVIASQRQDALNLQMLIVQILVAVISAVGVSLGCNVLLLGVLQLLSSLLSGLIGYRLAKIYLPEAKFTLHWSAEHGKKLGSYAGLAVFVALGGRIIYYADTLVIGAFISVAAIAGYAVVLKLVELLRSLVNTGAAAVGTFASEQHALNQHDSLRKIWYEGTKWSLVITVPVGGIIILLRETIISHWVGAQYLWIAPALVWLMIGHIFDLTQSAAFVTLLNTGRLKFLLWVISLEAICNLSLSIWLGRKIGITGVAIGTTLPLIFRCVFAYPIYMSRLVGASPLDYLRSSVFPALCAVGPLCVVLICFALFHVPVNPITVIALLSLVALLFVQGVFRNCLSSSQQTHLVQRLRSKLSL